MSETKKKYRVGLGVCGGIAGELRDDLRHVLDAARVGVVLHEVLADADVTLIHAVYPPYEGMLKAVGVDPASFTSASLQGVMKDGQVYGLPFDAAPLLPPDQPVELLVEAESAELTAPFER